MLFEPHRVTKEDSQFYRVFMALAFAEGVSYLLLMFVAMPLKYFLDQPLAVKYTGWAHGVLFVAFCLFLPVFMIKERWSFMRALRAFVLALLPFGTFRRL